MKPLRIEDVAEEELHGATDYYESKRPGLGLVFAERIHEAFLRIQRNPIGLRFTRRRPARNVSSNSSRI